MEQSFAVSLFSIRPEPPNLTLTSSWHTPIQIQGSWNLLVGPDSRVHDGVCRLHRQMTRS